MGLMPEKRTCTVAIALVLALAGCASATGGEDGTAQTQVSASVTTKLPKSHPCQNLHVRPPTCPPR